MRPGSSCAARFVRALSLVAACAAIAPAQKPVAEPLVGLEFRPPKGWIELPGDGDRHATVRLWCAPRVVAGKEGTHMPLMRVMFFPKGGDAAQDVVEGLPRQTPFRGLEDFVRRGLGGKDVQRATEKVGTVEGERLTVKGLQQERTLVGVRVPIEDGEAAVCFEVVELQFDKLKKEFEGTLSSLAVVPRQAGERRVPPWLGDGWAGMDASAKQKARREWATAVVAATEAAPEFGYKVSKSKHWIVLSATDAGFTKKAIAAAETMRGWCEKQMPELCKDAPLPAVLRIFDTPDQYAAFQTTQSDPREFQAQRRELHFARDRDNGGNTGYGMLFATVLWQLFDDVDPGVLPAMPRWLDTGCYEFVRSSRCDGKKLEFFAGDTERGRIENQQRANTMPALWELMQESVQPSPADGADEERWGYTPECARLMRWFWIDGGQKAWERPTLVADYVRGLGQALAKVGPDPTLDVALSDLSAAQKKDRNTRFYQWRGAMLTAINDIVTPLQPDAWRALSDKWIDYNLKLK